PVPVAFCWSHQRGHDGQRPDFMPGRQTADKEGFQLMAQNEEAAKVGNGTPPSLNVLVQYVKDLSFESPSAPASLRAREKAPAIAINVNVNANPLSETEYDVTLTLNAKASADSE